MTNESYGGILIAPFLFLYIVMVTSSPTAPEKNIINPILEDIPTDMTINMSYVGIEENPMKEIERIIRNVSDSNAYNRQYPNIFDCTDFSREAVRQLQDKGYNASCIFGMLIERTVEANSTFIRRIPHTWVVLYLDNEEIFIEATRGYIIEKENYKNEYEERVRGKCI